MWQVRAYFGAGLLGVGGAGQTDITKILHEDRWLNNFALALQEVKCPKQEFKRADAYHCLPAATDKGNRGARGPLLPHRLAGLWPRSPRAREPPSPNTLTLES